MFSYLRRCEEYTCRYSLFHEGLFPFAWQSTKLTARLHRHQDNYSGKNCDFNSGMPFGKLHNSSNSNYCMRHFASLATQKHARSDREHLARSSSAKLAQPVIALRKPTNCVRTAEERELRRPLIVNSDSWRSLQFPYCCVS